MPSRSTCVLLLYSGIVGYASVKIVTWVEGRRSPRTTYPELSEIGMAMLAALPFVLAHRISQQCMLPVARAVVIKKSKWSSKLYVSKLERFGSAVFKFVFFATFSFYSYVHVLADAEWLPPELFGQGSTKTCWGERVTAYTPMKPSVKYFYYIAMAYHGSELAFQILFEHEKPDFASMFAHHITTYFLLFASYMGGFVRIGTLVLFVHDVSDIPVYGAKIFVDSRHKILTCLCLVGMLVTWGYLRLYVFPACIIRSTLFESEVEFVTLGAFNYYAFNVSLILLVCLHVYWYSLFLKMGWGYLFTGETKDVQANLSSMDLMKNVPETIKKDE